MTVEKTEEAKLLTSLVMMVFRLNGAILRAAEHISTPVGLTPARWQVLGVALQEPKTVSEISRNLGLARQSVQRLADVLVSEGMGEYVDNPAHVRAKLFAPTERALKTISALADAQSQWANNVSSVADAAQLSHCLALLNTLVERMDATEVSRTSTGRVAKLSARRD